MRTHRLKANKQRKYWYDQVALITIGKKPKSPLVSAEITIVRHYYRFLDWDGCVASMKPVVDGLIHCGIILDDSYKVTGPWNVSQEFLPRKEGGYVTIRIRETDI